MSTAEVNHPLVACLVKAEDRLGRNRVWRPAGSGAEQQAAFLQHVFKACRGEVTSIPEIESIVGDTATEINDFLKEHGFDIELDEFSGPESFGVASVLNVLVKWLVKGEETQLCVQRTGQVYPGAKLPNEDGMLQFRAANVDFDWDTNTRTIERGIITIKTQSDDLAHVIPMAEVPEGRSLVELAGELIHATDLKDMTGALREGLIIPMVNLDVEHDVGWLEQMETTSESGKRAWIEQAKQQSKLRLNHEGARAESAAAMEIGLECMPAPPFTVDEPFLFAITRPGLAEPLAVFHVTEEDWQDPGGLD